jgi:hypothetical protein
MLCIDLQQDNLCGRLIDDRVSSWLLLSTYCRRIGPRYIFTYAYLK